MRPHTCWYLQLNSTLRNIFMQYDIFLLNNYRAYTCYVNAVSYWDLVIYCEKLKNRNQFEVLTKFVTPSFSITSKLFPSVRFTSLWKKLKCISMFWKLQVDISFCSSYKMRSVRETPMKKIFLIIFVLIFPFFDVLINLLYY